LIVADDGLVKAHSAVLAAASPVFKQALNSSCQPLHYTVVLPGVQLVVVKIIIHFIYTGKITVPKEHCVLTTAIAALNDLHIKLHITMYVYIVSRLCIFMS